jgi:hypothetical protein
MPAQDQVTEISQTALKTDCRIAAYRFKKRDRKLHWLKGEPVSEQTSTGYPMI